MHQKYASAIKYELAYIKIEWRILNNEKGDKLLWLNKEMVI